MAKIELKFLDVTGNQSFLRVEAFNTENGQNDSESDVIAITGVDEGNDVCFWFDKSTAIKFAKTLRTEINKIYEREVDNG